MALRVTPTVLLEVSEAQAAEAAAAAAAAAQPAAMPAVAVPAGNWFTDPTQEMIVGFPNWGLAVGVGIALLLLMKKK